MIEVEIYGLYDPDTNELKYIGKARNSEKRLKSHIWDARRNKRPVCLWINNLVQCGKRPLVKVIERVSIDGWKDAERRLIAEARKTHQLLNLAPGGDMPFQTREQKQAIVRRLNAKLAADPKRLKWVYMKRDTAKLYARLKRKPDHHAYFMRLMMKCWAAERPDLYGEWASL